METPNDARLQSRAEPLEESFGRYRLLERIGQGSLAEVFKAKSFGVEGFEKILVIKRILPELVSSARFVDLFVHEAKLAVRLSHANIVQVFDLGKVESGTLPYYFIAMEYVAGLDLGALLSRTRRRGSPLSFGMAAFIAAEIAKGLDHAHRRRDEQMRPLGIVHRDISPQNVLLSWEGEVKVGDFGIGKARTALVERQDDEPSGVLLQGKYAYMSPEQAIGGEIDRRSDIFSLGTLLYEAIAGVHPFRRPGSEETLRRVQAAEYTPLEQLRADIPKSLAEIVTKALAKEKDERYADAGKLHEELLAFLYKSGERFGPNELSDWLGSLRNEPQAIEPPPPVTKPSPQSIPAGEPKLSTGLHYGKFVGRRDELQRLGELFALATRRKVQLVTLRGDRGIGKTRLLQEVERRLRRGQLEVALHAVLCRRDGSSEPLSGILAMLRTLVGLREDDSPERILTIEPRLRALDLREEEVGAVLTLLGAERGETSTQLLGSAMARMVTKLSEEQLHVFIWDRAEALDAESLAVLDFAVQRMAFARAVFVLAGSNGLTHDLERLSSHHEMKLAELAEADVASLVSARTGVRKAPTELVAFCQKRALGHPLFLEEIIRELVVSGSVVIENGGVVEMRPERMAEIPEQLSTLLTKRIERLSSQEQEVLRAAAVLGDPLSETLLETMLATTPSSLNATLSRLEELRLLEREAPQLLSFASTLVPELALEGASKEELCELHARAGAAYETWLREKGEERASRIGAHFEEAGERDRAAIYFARSGKHRVEARQWEGAARDLARALTLVSPSRHGAAELAGWIEDFARAAYKVRSASGFDEAAERLIERIDEDGEVPARVLSRVHLARALGATHAFDEAEEYVEAAQKLCDDDSLLRRVLHVEGELALRKGDFRSALRSLEKCADLLEGAEPDEAARIEAELAVALAAMGEGERALSTMKRAEGRETTKDPEVLAEAAKLRALMHDFAGQFIEAAGENERAIELGRHLGLSCEMGVHLHHLGDALLRVGDLPRAYASFQQAGTIFDRLGEERLAAQNRGYLAYIDALNGASAAEKMLKDAVGYASVHGYSWDEINGRYLLGLLHEHAGDGEAAKQELLRTRELADAVGHHRLVKDCDAALGRLG